MLTPATVLFVAAAFLSTTTSLVAQQRRSNGVPPGAALPAGPLQIPDIAPDPARPYVGVWEGWFHPMPTDSARLIVVIEYLNGGYHGYHWLADMPRPIEHVTDSVVDGALRWEQPNSGGGFVVYTGRLSGRNALTGRVTFRSFDPGPDFTPPPFALRRRAPGGRT